MDEYKPGLHIISSFNAESAKLKKITECQFFFNKLIDSLGLVKVGEVYYEFNNGGFTCTVCLTESHISIHTWPEFERATFDVFLSSYKRDNSERARRLYKETLQFFNALEESYLEVAR